MVGAKHNIEERTENFTRMDPSQTNQAGAQIRICPRKTKLYSKLLKGTIISG